MLALPLAGLLGLFAPGPSPTGEGVIYEPPTAEPEPVAEPEPEPPPTPEIVIVVPPTPPPRFEPEPASTFVVPAPALPPPPPPPSGAGRLVGGSFAVVLGLGAASALIVEATREDGNPQFAATTFIPLGLTGIGVGTYLLVRGAKARSNFNEWRAYTQRDPLPSGDGLIVGGIMSTLVGGVTLIAAGVQSRDPDAFDRPLTPALYGVGATGVVVGVGALTLGLLRRGQYRSWRQSTFLGRVTPTITPTITPLGDPGSSPGFVLRGASFGLVIRRSSG